MKTNIKRYLPQITVSTVITFADTQKKWKKSRKCAPHQSYVPDSKVMLVMPSARLNRARLIRAMHGQAERLVRPCVARDQPMRPPGHIVREKKFS